MTTPGSNPMQVKERDQYLQPQLLRLEGLPAPPSTDAHPPPNVERCRGGSERRAWMKSHASRFDRDGHLSHDARRFSR